MEEEKNKKDLDSFLSRVDEIESIVKGLASSDEDVSNTSIRKADALLNNINSDLVKNKIDTVQSDSDIPILKTGVDRTVINSGASKQGTGLSDIQQHNSAEPAAFLAALEKDCQERAERKKQMKKEAEKLKDKGNAEFSKGNYEKAVSLYSQATEKIKDWDILHTNLAQANIRLNQFEAALENCIWAFRVNERCLKAFILQGKAYVGLKQYEKAIESYREAIRVAPEKESMINTYIAQVTALVESESQEEDATRLFNAGDTMSSGLVDVLKKLGCHGQPPMYYSGGLRILKSLLNDVNSKTLLRLNGGLGLIKVNPVIAKCFDVATDQLSKQEFDVCAAYLEMLKSACDDNDGNRVEVIGQNDLGDLLHRYANSQRQNEAHVHMVITAVTQLLHIISETEIGRQGILAKYDAVSLTSSLSSLLISVDSCQHVILAIVNNLVLEKKFRTQTCSDAGDELISCIENVVEECDSVTIALTSFYILTNLAIETYNRRKFASRLQTWRFCLKALRKFYPLPAKPRSEELLSAVLGFLANLSLEKTGDDFAEVGLELCLQCSGMLFEKRLGEDSEGLQRLYLLISRLFIKGGYSFISICQNLVVPATLEILKTKGLNLPKSSVACLAGCTKCSDEAKHRIVDYPKGLKSIMDLLKSDDESIVGNAALCLSHCSDLPKVCKAFAKTNIIMDLLVLARDQMKPTVQHNCAILIAKLCQGDQRHLDRLRELHGLEILNTVMHHVKE